MDLEEKAIFARLVVTSHLQYSSNLVSDVREREWLTLCFVEFARNVLHNFYGLIRYTDTLLESNKRT